MNAIAKRGEMDLRRRFAVRLAILKASLCMSSLDMARAVGLSAGCFSYWKKLHGLPSVKAMYKLARGTAVEYGWLASGDGVERYTESSIMAFRRFEIANELPDHYAARITLAAKSWTPNLDYAWEIPVYYETNLTERNHIKSSAAQILDDLRVVKDRLDVLEDKLDRLLRRRKS
jgi:hypothetical protein